MKENIKDKIKDIDWNNFDLVIEFYESNQLYFDNYESISDIDALIEICHIKLTYCNSLISKKRYTKCLPVLNQVNILVEKLKTSKSGNELNERYMYIEGAVYGYLKRYEESNSNFKQLLKIDPDNDVYKDWYESNRTSSIFKQSSIIGYAGFGLIFLSIFLDAIKKTQNWEMLSAIGFALMSIGFGLPYLIRFIRKLKQ